MGNQQNLEGTGAEFLTQAEINKLYKRFQKLDTDKSGDLELEEILGVKNLTDNPLVKRVIAIFDKNKDGKLSFVEFLTCIATLSTNADEEMKLKFAFQVYDKDEDGFISNGDLFSVLKMMVGDNLNDVQLQQLVDRTIIDADLDCKGMISYDDFKKMVKDLDIANKLTISYD